MLQHRFLGLAGVVMIAIAGCASEEPPPVETSPAPSPVTASPSPTPAPQAGKPATTQPLTAQRPAPLAPVAGLIPSTNAQEREKQVRTEAQAGRTADPFSGLPPALPQPTTASPVPNVAQLPASPPAATGNTGNAGNTPGTRQRPNAAPTPRTVSGIPPQRAIGESPTIPQPQEADEGAIGTFIPPVLPPTATAEAAQAIEVTGVVAVGTVPQAIVQSPDEPSSRYVSVGQRLSNGRVLVKRIDINPGGEPVVVFEQNGIEVAKSVGEKVSPRTTKVS